MVAFTSCNKMCECEVTKNGQRIESHDYSDQGLSRSECEAKVEETWTNLNEHYTTESLVGVKVECVHL